MHPPSFISESRMLTVWAVCARIPGFEIRFKDESRLMRVLGALLHPVNPDFMTSYVTTVGSKVYFPNRKDFIARQDMFAEVLAHEYVHLYDAQKNKLFGVWYLMPQLLAVFALLAFGAFWCLPMLWFLGFLVFLAPIPSPWRTYYEVRGYCMSMLVEFVVTEDIPPSTVTWILTQFTGPSYYWMWPFRDHIYDTLRDYAQTLKKQRVPNIGDPKPFTQMWDALELLNRDYENRH